MYSRRRIVFAFDVCCAPYEIAESWLLLLLLCTQTVSAEKTRQKDAPVIERTLQILCVPSIQQRKGRSFSPHSQDSATLGYYRNRGWAIHVDVLYCTSSWWNRSIGKEETSPLCTSTDIKKYKTDAAIGLLSESCLVCGLFGDGQLIIHIIT